MKLRSIILKKFYSDFPIWRRSQVHNLIFLFLAGLLLTTGCNDRKTVNKNWTQLVPSEAPVTFAPSSAVPLDSMFTSSYAPFLNDITASSAQFISKITLNSEPGLKLEAMYLFASSANQWKPVWITRDHTNYMKRLQQKYYQNYIQNEYYFKEQRVQIIHYQQQKAFATKLGNRILLSDNSLALEEAIRAYMDSSRALNINLQPTTGNRLIINTPYLDRWIKQLVQVTYRPSVEDAFKGTRPLVLNVRQHPSNERKKLTLSGTQPIKSIPETSTIIESISDENKEFQLDSYIPQQAAGYGIFHLKPHLAPPKQVPHPSTLDSLLINNASLYQRLAKTLDTEFALTMFPESGYLSRGEHFFLRSIKDRSQFIDILQQFVNSGLVNREGNIYNLNSLVLAKLMGSPLCNFDDMYLGVSSEVLVFSKRQGLTESVISEFRRGRVVRNQKMHQNILNSINPPLSALVVAESRSFLKFIQPFLAPNHYVDALLSQFDLTSISFKKQSEKSVDVQIDTYKQPETTAPFRERWAYSLSGTDITNKPTLADIGGSSREEIIFATKAGKVHVLASDGTEILQTSTGTDTPVGSPLVYDWYGNNQNIILQAAGNKIYGWNTRGNSLPQFPMVVDEKISAPPKIADVNRDGMPELLITTSDRKIHVLNGRGNDIPGWPQKTNSIINTPLVFEKINGHWSVLAYAANTLHAWLSDGSLRPGFPKFIQATFRGHPVVVDNHILGNAADGRLYAVSENPPFLDSLTVQKPENSSPDSLKVDALPISNDGLIGHPELHDLTLITHREDTVKPEGNKQKPVRGSFILTASTNGSVFLLDKQGVVKQSYNIGQPISPNLTPFVADLQQDGNKELFVLSGFGRLIVWNLRTGQRSFNLPTQSLQFPVITDLDKDGNMDLIAQSQNGIRCWALLNP